MKDYFEVILREKKTAFALFDQDLILQEYSLNLKQYIAIQVKKNNPLWDVFPELIGSEDVVKSVVTRKKRRFIITKLTRFKSSGQSCYYHLTILPYTQNGYAKLLCIVSDGTQEVALEHEIQQKKYEIMLLQSTLQRSGIEAQSGFIGRSAQIQSIHEFVKKIAPVRSSTVLLQGESGTGKNLAARIIHNASMQQGAPFVEINCAGIPDTLLESEIFGYEKGAFTHALSSKKGLLETADGGTLFLDEIGELPFSLQSKFLAFLESKRFRRLGDTQERQVDVRIIAATNKDLMKAVQNKEFREDLFFRLNVINLELPPLRELDDDIILLAENFINHFAYSFHKTVSGLSDSAIKKLKAHRWSGNVRELRNVIERAVIFTENSMLDAPDLILIGAAAISDSWLESIQIPQSGISLPELEQYLINSAMNKAEGNVSRAARLLGLSLDTLRYRLKKGGTLS
ncbi:sigma 54-interacting transcriptional regulator [bacterium]|nr:sigma 54-interacting transcriptional regulator [bacterium]